MNFAATVCSSEKSSTEQPRINAAECASETKLLEVVSHADCRACLFTSLSILQMIDVGLLNKFFLKRLSRMRLDMTFCTYDVLCHNEALLF